MSKITRVLRCNSCGVALQSEDITKVGFIPRDLFDDKRDRVIYCNDCYRDLQINIGKTAEQIDSDIIKVLDDAVASDALICFVIDLFSFNGSINSTLAKKIKNNDILVVGNKRDLFASNIKDEVLIEYLKERFAAVGIVPSDVILVSATKNYNIDLFQEKLTETRKRHDVYLIGSSLSGKSAIIDVLLTVFKNTSRRTIQSETYPGTNLRILAIPFDNSSTLYEIPGFLSGDSVQYLLEKDVLKYVIPKKEIKRDRKRLSSGTSLILGGLAFFSLLEGESIDVDLYMAEGVEVKKVVNTQVTEFFKINLIKREVRPVSERLNGFQKYDLYDVVLNGDGQLYDISIKGLGWMAIKGKKQTVRVLAPRGASLTVFKSKIR